VLVESHELEKLRRLEESNRDERRTKAKKSEVRYKTCIGGCHNDSHYTIIGDVFYATFCVIAWDALFSGENWCWLWDIISHYALALLMDLLVRR
jgi:hypothetical protein